MITIYMIVMTRVMIEIIYQYVYCHSVKTTRPQWQSPDHLVTDTTYQSHWHIDTDSDSYN